MPRILSLAETTRDPLAVAHELEQPKMKGETVDYTKERITDLLLHKVGDCNGNMEIFLAAWQRLQQKDFFTDTTAFIQLTSNHRQPILKIGDTFYNPSKPVTEMKITPHDLAGTCILSPEQQISSNIEPVHGQCYPLAEGQKVGSRGKFQGNSVNHIQLTEMPKLRATTGDQLPQGSEVHRAPSYKKQVEDLGLSESGTRDINKRSEELALVSPVVRKYVAKRILESGNTKSLSQRQIRILATYAGETDDAQEKEKVARRLVGENPNTLTNLAKKDTRVQSMYVDTVIRKKIDTGSSFRNEEVVIIAEYLFDKDVPDEKKRTLVADIMEQNPENLKALARLNPIATRTWAGHRSQELEKIPRDAWSREDKELYDLNQQLLKEQTTVAIYRIGNILEQAKKKSITGEEAKKQIETILQNAKEERALNMLKLVADHLATPEEEDRFGMKKRVEEIRAIIDTFIQGQKDAVEKAEKEKERKKEENNSSNQNSRVL
ncbi:MAG: hypothetical protein ABII02_01625 [Candidatus Magasanikbacteria bacterium]